MTTHNEPDLGKEWWRFPFGVLLGFTSVIYFIYGIYGWAVITMQPWVDFGIMVTAGLITLYTGVNHLRMTVNTGFLETKRFQLISRIVMVTAFCIIAVHLVAGITRLRPENSPEGWPSIAGLVVSVTLESPYLRKKQIKKIV